jgi:hypothetical protein
MSSVQTISASSPSICIPRVFDNITRDFIGKTFDELLDGSYVDSIDMVNKTDDKGAKFKRVYIHFRSWPTRNRQIVEVREKLLAGGEVKVMYDDPWFWKCSASKSERPGAREERARQERRAPFIINDDNERSVRARSPSPRRAERTQRYNERQHEYRRYEHRNERPRHYDSRRPEPVQVPKREACDERPYVPTTPPSGSEEKPPRRQRINYVPPGVPVKIKKVLKVKEPESAVELAIRIGSQPLPPSLEENSATKDQSDA